MSNAGNQRTFRIAGLCGIAVPVLTVVALSLAISSSGWFSWTSNTLSDLGASYPSAYFFNGSLILAGFLTMIFGRGLYSYLPRERLPRLGAVLLLLGSLSLLLIGVFTSHAGIIHNIVSVLFYTLTLVAIIIIGISELRNSQKTGAIAVVLGLVAISMFALPWPGDGLALPETASILFTMGFTLVYGVRLLDIKK
jgi:hypothetical membrane protein